MDRWLKIIKYLLITIACIWLAPIWLSIIIVTFLLVTSFFSWNEKPLRIDEKELYESHEVFLNDFISKFENLEEEHERKFDAVTQSWWTTWLWEKQLKETKMILGEKEIQSFFDEESDLYIGSFQTYDKTCRLLELNKKENRYKMYYSPFSGHCPWEKINENRYYIRPEAGVLW